MSISTHTVNLNVLFSVFLFVIWGIALWSSQCFKWRWWQWWVNWCRRNTWPECRRQFIQTWAATGSGHYFSSSFSTIQALRWRKPFDYSISPCAENFNPGPVFIVASMKEGVMVMKTSPSDTTSRQGYKLGKQARETAIRSTALLISEGRFLWDGTNFTTWDSN